MTDTPDLDALERLAKAAARTPEKTWDSWSTASPRWNMAAALDPATVLWLIERARLGQAWEADVERLARAMHYGMTGSTRGLGDRPDLWLDAARETIREYAKLAEPR